MKNINILKIPFGNRKVLYGRFASKYLVEELKERNLGHAFVCTDSGLGKTAMFREFVEMLKNGGIKVTIYDEVLPNPLAENIENGKKALLESDSDCVIGFGGGSSMDAAKMITALASSEGDIIEYTSHYVGMKKFNPKKHYLIGIPTTAGTGSEMDNCACVVDYNGRKQNVFSDELYYDLAVIDPTFLYNCPKKVIAACGIDAMCHSLERYIGKPNMIFDVCALKSIDLALKNLENAYKNIGEEYRDQMAMSSFLSGVILDVGVGAKSVPVHSIALPLSMRYHLSHGESLAAVLPYVLERVIEVLPEPVAAIGRYIGIIEKDDKVCARLFCIELQRMIRALDLEISRDIDVTEEEIEALANTAIISKTTTDNEILPCDFEKCCAIYRCVFNHEIIELN